MSSADEVLPPVDFDIRLGQQYKHIDFDYALYESYLAEQGVTVADVIEHQGVMRFKPVKATQMATGTYNRFTREINVFVDPARTRRKPRKLNRTVLHESTHMADDIKGELGSPAANFVVTVGRYATIAAATALGASIGAGLGIRPLESSIDLQPYTEFLTGSVKASGIAFLASLTTMAYYYAKGDERRARDQATKFSESHPVITVTPH